LDFGPKVSKLYKVSPNPIFTIQSEEGIWLNLPIKFETYPMVDVSEIG
jgi:hypothetical protein